MLADITFKDPWVLYLLILIPIWAGWQWYRYKDNRSDVVFSDSGMLDHNPTLKERLVHLPLILRLLGMGLLIVALARPQSSSSWQDVTTEGIDIVMSLDISGSMQAEDFKPNRLEASKKVASNFIDNRPTDRVGLVVFAGQSFTQCPLTTDHSVIKNLFGGIKQGMLEDGTAIGMGLATAVKRLKDSEAKSKVIILLTDGDNNSGSIAPETAAEIAQKFNIRVYTIGVGTQGMAPMPYKSPFGGVQYQDVEVKINEPLLREIADKTGGKYFRATDNESLENVYAEIDQLEKSKIDVTEYRKKKEEYLPWVLIGFLLVFLDVILRSTYLRSIPA